MGGVLRALGHKISNKVDDAHTQHDNSDDVPLPRVKQLAALFEKGYQFSNETAIRDVQFGRLIRFFWSCRFVSFRFISSGLSSPTIVRLLRVRVLTKTT